MLTVAAIPEPSREGPAEERSSTGDALLQSWHPMVSVALLKVRQAPIIARDDPPTPRGAASARHREPGRTRLGAVINCQLLASSNGPSSGDVIRAYMPQVGITTVISEMGHARGRQDEMNVLVDRHSVDIWGRGISLGLVDQPRQLRRGDQPTGQANDDQVGGEALGGEEALALNCRLPDGQLLVQPEVFGMRSIQIDMAFHDFGDALGSPNSKESSTGQRPPDLRITETEPTMNASIGSNPRCRLFQASRQEPGLVRPG